MHWLLLSLPRLAPFVDRTTIIGDATSAHATLPSR